MKRRGNLKRGIGKAVAGVGIVGTAAGAGATTATASASSEGTTQNNFWGLFGQQGSGYSSRKYDFMHALNNTARDLGRLASPYSKPLNSKVMQPAYIDSYGSVVMHFYDYDRGILDIFAIDVSGNIQEYYSPLNNVEYKTPVQKTQEEKLANLNSILHNYYNTSVYKISPSLDGNTVIDYDVFHEQQTGSNYQQNVNDYYYQLNANKNYQQRVNNSSQTSQGIPAIHQDDLLKFFENLLGRKASPVSKDKWSIEGRGPNGSYYKVKIYDGEVVFERPAFGESKYSCCAFKRVRPGVWKVDYAIAGDNNYRVTDARGVAQAVNYLLRDLGFNRRVSAELYSPDNIMRQFKVQYGNGEVKNL